MYTVYKIRNTNNERCYYGVTANVDIRWSMHSNELKRSEHHCVKLQSAYNEGGDFVYEVVDTFDDPLSANKLEHELITDDDSCYNTLKALRTPSDEQYEMYNRIKGALADAGMTQEELARKTGMHKQTISQICRNASQPTMKTLYNIAEAIGVSPKELLTR